MTKHWPRLGLPLVLMALLLLSFSASSVHGEAYTYILKASVDNSANYDEGLPAVVSISADFTAGQLFFFNFTKGRFWGVEYDQEYGLEPFNPNFAPNTSIEPYKMVKFYIYTPSGDAVLCEVYVVGGFAPFAVAYLNQSADFVPVPDGNLTFTSIGMEGMVQRSGSYTVKVIDIEPHVMRDPSHTYNISSDPATGDLPLQMYLYDVIVNPSVVFEESGLPSGVPWWVDLDGDNKSSASNAIDFSEPNGTYTCSTGASGYIASPPSGSVTVSLANLNQTITFTVAPALDLLLYVSIIIVVLAVFGIGGFLVFRRRKSRGRIAPPPPPPSVT